MIEAAGEAAAKEAAGAVVEAGTQLVPSAIRKIRRRMLDQPSIENQVAFKKYLARSQRAIRMVRTILYRHEDCDIDEFFECTDLLRCHLDGTSTTIRPNDLEDVLTCGNGLVITGIGGSGKSMMLRHLFLRTLDTEYIPVFIELREVNDTSCEAAVSLRQLVRETLARFGCELDEETFEYSLKTGSYLLLFDGYDEVRGAYAPTVARQLCELRERYPELAIVVSSRPGEDGFVAWAGFTELEMCSLSKEQALSLVQRLRYDDAVKKVFLRRLDERLFESHKSFASSPLLLTVMLMTFEDHGHIPTKMTDFYAQAFRTLFDRHDAVKRPGWRREIHTGLGYGDFERLVARFCLQTFFKDEQVLGEEVALERIGKVREKEQVAGSFFDKDFLRDLTDAVCLLVREGDRYRFVHRSFQEYFAAVCTTRLPDDKWAALARAWLGEQGGYISVRSEYLRVLYALEPERYARNVWLAGLREFRDACRASSDPDIWYLEHRVISLGPLRRRLGNDLTVGFRFFYKSSYEHLVIIDMQRRKPEIARAVDLFYLERSKERGSISTKRALPAERFAENLAELDAARRSDGKPGGVRRIPFRRIVQEGMVAEFLDAFPEILQERDAVFAELDRIEQAAEQPSGTAAAMVDEL